jgi:hypothetical protein
MTHQSIFQSDYKPFMLRTVRKDDGEDRESFQVNPLFINSTTYGMNYANWGTSPFERRREIGNRPFKS